VKKKKKSQKENIFKELRTERMNIEVQKGSEVQMENDKSYKEYKDRIDIIHDMMDISIRKYNDNGFFLIFFGFYSLIGVVLTYLLIYLKVGRIFSNLMLIYWIGIPILFVFILSIYFKKREQNINFKYENIVKKNDYVFGRIIGAVWSTSNLTTFILFFLLMFFISRSIDLNTLLSLISLFLAIPYFITGAIIKRGWILQIASLFWLICFVFMNLIGKNNQGGLYFECFVVCCQIVPGLILMKQKKEEIDEKSAEEKIKNIKKMIDKINSTQKDDYENQKIIESNYCKVQKNNKGKIDRFFLKPFILLKYILKPDIILVSMLYTASGILLSSSIFNKIIFKDNFYIYLISLLFLVPSLIMLAFKMVKRADKAVEVIGGKPFEKLLYYVGNNTIFSFFTSSGTLFALYITGYFNQSIQVLISVSYAISGILLIVYCSIYSVKINYYNRIWHKIIGILLLFLSGFVLFLDDLKIGDSTFILFFEAFLPIFLAVIAQYLPLVINKNNNINDIAGRS